MTGRFWVRVVVGRFFQIVLSLFFFALGLLLVGVLIPDENFECDPGDVGNVLL